MILGFSDAKLTVRKRGGPEVRAQGVLCERLGYRVAPRVEVMHEDGYEMELLEPAPYRSVLQLAEVLNRLRTQVWERRELVVPWDNPGRPWLEHLVDWSQLAPWLTKPIRDVYPEEPTVGYCLIHGDPALSNLMMRGGYAVLSDPMPRLSYRREIPSLREVDYGKLLQSACGWERTLGCDSGLWDEPETLLHMIPDEDRQTAVLWGAIHLARVVIRATKRGKQEIAHWAWKQSNELVRSFL